MASIVSLLTDTCETIHAKAFTIGPPSEPTRRLGRYHPVRTQVWTGKTTQILSRVNQYPHHHSLVKR
jgi:hypothetical protein